MTALELIRQLADTSMHGIDAKVYVLSPGTPYGAGVEKRYEIVSIGVNVTGSELYIWPSETPKT